MGETEDLAAQPEARRSGPYTVEVVGDPEGLRFPPMCLKCAAPAGGTLPVHRMFWRSPSEGGGYHTFATVTAPFCPACIQAHEREHRPISPEVKRKLMLSWLVQSLPYVIPLVIGVLLTLDFTPKLLRRLAGGGDLFSKGASLLILVFFAGIAISFLRMILGKGQMLVHTDSQNPTPCYVTMERGPLGSGLYAGVAPTSTLRALSFSDDCSEAFDPRRHAYTFENQDAAAAFAQQNAEQRWDPSAPAARRSHTLRWVLTGAFVLFAAYHLLRDFLR